MASPGSLWASSAARPSNRPECRRASSARNHPDSVGSKSCLSLMPELGLHPGIVFALAIGLFLGLHLLLRWPLPLTFVAVAVATALVGDFGIPFRHVVEGAFGFFNLVLALFAGAFFGQMMRRSGAADAAAAGIVTAAGARVLPVLALAGLPLFVVGMFV